MKGARRQGAASASRDDVPGLAARRVAADIVDAVLQWHRPLDEQFEGAGAMLRSPAFPSATAP